MRAINVLLAILVAVLIFVLGLEGGLRLIGLGPAKTLNRFDTNLGWSKVPDTSVDRAHVDGETIHFEFNGSSLREDDHVHPEKLDEKDQLEETTTTRIAILGDSFVLGYAVNRNDLFVDLLENRWNAEGRNVELINTGTEGWSTDQQAAWLESNGALWKPDVVIVFPFENDLVQNGETSYGSLPKPRFAKNGELDNTNLQEPPPKPFTERWALPLLLFGKSRSQASTTKVRGASKPIKTEFMALLNDPPAEVEYDQDLDHTSGALKAMQSTAAELKARLIVAPIPGKAAIVKSYRDGSFAKSVMNGLDPLEWDAERPVNEFIRIAKELGIETLDARTQIAARQAELEKTPESGSNSTYFDVDWHLNAHGNRALASFLYDSLEGTEGIPAATSALVTDWPAAANTSGGLPGWLKWYASLWVLVGLLYCVTYRDENAVASFLKVGVMIGLVFTIAIGGTRLIGMLPPSTATLAMVGVIIVILGFVAYKLGDRIGTICELLKAFVLRGHWYLMPLVVVLLTVGSLLVVAASSPLVAPFIYTLF